MLYLERWDVAVLGIGSVEASTRCYLGCSSQEQWIFVGLREIPPRQGEGPEIGLAEIKLISQRHLSVADIR